MGLFSGAGVAVKIKRFNYYLTTDGGRQTQQYVVWEIRVRSTYLYFSNHAALCLISDDGQIGTSATIRRQSAVCF